MSPLIKAIFDLWKAVNPRVDESAAKRWSVSSFQNLQGAFEMISGVIQIMAGLLTGDFSKAWEGVKTVGPGRHASE